MMCCFSWYNTPLPWDLGLKVYIKREIQDPMSEENTARMTTRTTAHHALQFLALYLPPESDHSWLDTQHAR
jgi:hypothetical protein